MHGFIYYVMFLSGTLEIQTYLAILYQNLENLNVFNTCKFFLVTYFYLL